MRNETLETVPEPIDVQSQAVTVRDAVTALEPIKDQTQPSAPQRTSQECRVLEVSEALLPAYQKASTLELSDAEVEALMAPFPDEVVECRPHDGLLYIPHICVSDRLNRIFKPGKWALIRRREWFSEGTMFAEYVLLIRGAFVGESIGGHPFARNNPKINYSDVLESTAAEALRRICGKRLSCGSQVWNPEYCRQWEERFRFYANGKYGKRRPDSPKAPPTPSATAPRQQAPTAAPVPKVTNAGTGEQTLPVVTVERVKEVHSKPDSAKKWTAFFITFNDGFGQMEAATFDRKIADFANELANTSESACLVTKPGRKEGSKEIVSLVRAEQPPTNSDTDQVPMEFDSAGNPIPEGVTP